ncbi:hypothetical protein X777_08715 [Ooceraea biroi]|uniref:Uncharacterized protein n=1 Tax=Ooceraea biroi TaxID=2015173 RepID=A0A026W7X5_OOCBI|nr:hypothetical protein X777_08715 [Ooceraea biroi]
MAKRPNRETSGVKAQDIVEPRAPADDGDCRRVRACVRVGEPQRWQASQYLTTTRESAAAASGVAACGGYDCDLPLGCYGCLRGYHHCWTRCGYEDGARRRPQRKPRVTDDVSWNHSRDAPARPRGDSKVVRARCSDGDDYRSRGLELPHPTPIPATPTPTPTPASEPAGNKEDGEEPHIT